MKHFLAVVLFAIIAGLVSWQVASEHGLKGLPATVRHALGLPEGATVEAKFESVGIEAADVKAKVAHVVAETKAKVAEVAEKAVEAAKPDRSESVTPAPEDEAAAPAAQEPAAAEQESAAAEPPAPPAEEPAPAAPVAGVTHYYGESNGTAVAAWAGAATMNPDYEPADATGESLAATESAAPAAPAADETSTAASEPPAAPVEQPAAEAPAEPAAPAPETTAEATPEAAPAPAEEAKPAPTGGDGQTSYFGLASKPDSDQPWAAAAAPNTDYTPGSEQQAAAPAADTSTDAPQSTEQPAAAVEEAPPAPAAEEAAPAQTGGDGQTSYFGLANMPDEDQPWSAAAAMNPDYTPGEAPTPAAEPSADQAATTPEPAPASEPVAAPAEEPAPQPTGEKGVSSFFGIAEKADATQPWAAAAAMNPDYTAAVASPPVESPATQEAVEACRDALNAEAQTGGLRFGLERWDVTPENYGALDKIAKLAKDCGGVVIEVRGHTDNTGKPKSNQTLSDLRAKAVITYLTKAGVPLSKLKAVGFGEDKPVGDNSTAKGRAENRRIEFVVTGS